MKINQIGRSILTNFLFSRMVQMRRCFLTTCTKPLHKEKNIKQMSCYRQEKGRSMVEMLGVLAIIGVLSVGAIAGYSKAMNKHKINRTVQEYNVFISGLLQYRHDLTKLPTASDSKLIDYAQKMDIMPTIKNITSNGDLKSFIDMAGNKVRIYIVNESEYSKSNAIGMNLTFSTQNNETYSFNTDLCVSMLQNLLIPLHENLIYTLIYKNNGNTDSYENFMFGDNFCTKNRTCLVNIDIAKTHEICSNCLEDSSCSLVIRF